MTFTKRLNLIVVGITFTFLGAIIFGVL